MPKKYYYKGEMHTLAIWASKNGISLTTLYNRLKKQKLSLHEAINKKYKDKKPPVAFSVEGYVYRIATTTTSDDSVTNERLIKLKDEICSHFGCSRKLTITEKLYGNKCFKHS